MAIVIWLSEPMRLTIEVYLLKLQQVWFSIRQAIFG
jgi:hypothetical protein